MRHMGFHLPNLVRHHHHRRYQSNPGRHHYHNRKASGIGLFGHHYRRLHRIFQHLNHLRLRLQLRRYRDRMVAGQHGKIRLLFVRLKDG